MTGSEFRRLLLVSDGRAATQQISFFNPLAGSVDLEWVETNAVGAWLGAPALRPDAVVVSRVTDRAGEQILRWAREAGVPGIYHIDDDLLAVPKSLGEGKFQYYSDPSRVAQLRRNMEASDLVYASTGPLRSRLLETGVSRPVVNGSLYCSIDPSALNAPLYATGPVFGYMGTSGHHEDLNEILPAIETVLSAFPSAEFEVFGTIRLPERLTSFGSRVRHHAAVGNYDAFLSRMHRLGWWCGLAPVADNSFNRCKADTKWVEYTFAGAAVVASDIQVYDRACHGGAGLLAQTREQWTTSILTVLSDPRQRDQLVSVGRERLQKEYCHSVLRSQIIDVLGQARDISKAART